MKPLRRLLAIAAASLMLAGCMNSSAAPESSFTLLDGSTMTTSDLKGKVALINFWATSCTTCVAEMPMLSATYEKFRSRGYETIAVAMNYDPPVYVGSSQKTENKAR
jgi:thiol-disulfide isomerase/thioredoxin